MNASVLRSTAVAFAAFALAATGARAIRTITIAGHVFPSEIPPPIPGP